MSNYDVNLRGMVAIITSDGVLTGVFAKVLCLIQPKLQIISIFKFDDHFDWGNDVVGHFDPSMVTLSWNFDNTVALSDEDIIKWNATTVVKLAEL